jgi:hypothetical protein
MGIKVLNHILTTLGLAGHVCLTTLLIRRKLALRLPVFTVLIVFYLVRSGILLFANYRGISQWLYWTVIGLDPVFQCLLCGTILHAWWPSARTSRNAHTLAVAGLVVIAVASSGVAAWYIGPSSRFSAENLSIKAGVFVSVLWIEAGLALAASSAGLSTQLPMFTRRVVQGFAIYSAANVITEIGHMHFARVRAAQPYVERSYLRVGAYLFCVGWWIAACYRAPRIPAAPAATLTSV